jgi:hypothetical protein
MFPKVQDAGADDHHNSDDKAARPAAIPIGRELRTNEECGT